MAVDSTTASCVSSVAAETIEDSTEASQSALKLSAVFVRQREELAVREKASVWEEHPKLRNELREWREKYDALEDDLRKLQGGRLVIRTDTSLNSVHQTASYDVETTSNVTVVTYNTRCRDLEETREVFQLVESGEEDVNQLLRQQMLLLGQTNRNLCRKVERLNRNLLARDHSHERFRDFVSNERKTLAELESLISTVKKDYKCLRNYIAQLLGDYRDEFISRKLALRSEMIEQAASERDSPDFIEMPRIMIHSGSMTEDDLQSSVSKLERSLNQQEKSVLYAAIEGSLDALTTGDNSHEIEKLRILLTSDASVDDTVDLLNQCVKSVPKSRPASRTRSPRNDEDLPIETILHHLQYEAKIKDLEQQLVSVASEKQRLANELNRATDSRVRDASSNNEAFAMNDSKAKLEPPFGALECKDQFVGQLSEPSSLSDDTESRWCSEIQTFREHIGTLQQQLEAQRNLCDQLLREKQLLIQQLAELRDEKRRSEDTMNHRSREQQKHIETLAAKCDELVDGRSNDRKERSENQTISTLKLELEKLAGEVRILSEENLRLKNKTLITSQEWRNMFQKVFDENVHSADVRRLELEKSQLTQQSSEARVETAAFQRDVDQLQGRILHLSKTLSANKDELTKERNAKQEAEALVQRLESEIEKMRTFYDEQLQQDRNWHQKSVDELKLGYEIQITELRDKFKVVTEDYNTRLKHEMYPVLEEFQKLSVSATEAEVEISTLKKSLEREKEEIERLQTTDRASKLQLIALNKEISDLQSKRREDVLQVEDLRRQYIELKSKFECSSRSNLAMKSDLAKLTKQLEHSEMARTSLEKECMTLRENVNHSTTLIQSECSQMQERIAVLLREKETLAKQASECQCDKDVLQARITMLEMQLEDRRSQAIADDDEHQKQLIKHSEVKDHLNQVRLELEISKERVLKLEAQRLELLGCREDLRRIISLLMPMKQNAHTNDSHEVVDHVRNLMDEVDTYRAKLGTADDNQLSNVKSLCLSESMRNFEDSKKATELQRELTVKEARINVLEQSLMRLQTEIDLQKQLNEVRLAENLPLEQHSKVVMHAKLHKTLASLKLMEQKYQAEIDAEREANLCMRLQIVDLEDNREVLRRALDRSQNEVEALKRNRDLRALEAPPPLQPSSKYKEKNYKNLYRQLKHDYSFLREKYEETVLRKGEKGPLTHEFTTTSRHLLAQLSKSLHNVSRDPECLLDESRTLMVSVKTLHTDREAATRFNSGEE